MYLGATNGRIILRQQLEARIVKAVVKEGLKQGYSLSVDNGDMEEMIPTRNRKKVIDAIMETDEDHLLLYRDGVQIGWIRFVYGNDGWDVISDYSANKETESVLIPANQIIKQYDK